MTRGGLERNALNFRCRLVVPNTLKQGVAEQLILGPPRELTLDNHLGSLPPDTRGKQHGDDGDAFAPPHSITSSARARSVGGIERLRALAVLRFKLK